MAKSKKKYYAVAAGHAPGLYTSWAGPGGAQEQVAGFPNARYKGFYSLQDALAYLAEHGVTVSGYEAQETKLDDDRVYMFTDGGALNNPGPGGYGVVILYQGKRKELSGGYRLTTNNRMELRACIEGLNSLPTGSPVTLYSDSSYIVNAVQKGWLDRWRANNWLKSNKQPVENVDLWRQLAAALDKKQVEFVWVKGHAGKKENERCDELATAAIKSGKYKIDEGFESRGEPSLF